MHVTKVVANDEPANLIDNLGPAVVEFARQHKHPAVPIQTATIESFPVRTGRRFRE